MKIESDPSILLKQEKQKLISENKRVIDNFTMRYIKDSDGKLKPNIFEKKANDGSTYIGELDGSLKHGKGIYYYANGDVYFGDWIKD